MSRPRPLNNLSSAISFTDDNASLTPRTPHSRTARLEGGFAQLQDHHLSQSGQDLFITQQREPLLASAQTDHFDFVPLPSKPKPTPPREQHSRTTRALLVLGLAVAAVLLLLIIVSYNWPGPFYRYFGLEDYVSGIQQQAHPAHSSNSTAHTPHSTISYENYTSFPLTGVQYLLECQKQMPGYMSHGDYWDMPLHSSHPMDVEHVADPNHRICNKTLTYLLDGRVGLAADLALMAQAAAIARERNRTFFVDDTYWNRGKWIDYFEDVRTLQPGPEPGCLPPPPEELVACPRHARHWVINSLSAKYHLGHEFENHYEDSYAHELNRAKPIFEFARESFSSTIRPNHQMTHLINVAKQELLEKIPGIDKTPTMDSHTSNDASYLSVHIRRGDRVPHGWMHHHQPIPLQEYIDALENRTTYKPTDGLSESRPSPTTVYIASDSPQDIEALSKVYKGPSFSLSVSNNPLLRDIASRNAYFQVEFNNLPFEERHRATKGALVDLALVTGLWASREEPHLDTVICTASSNFGRLAAIGLGWEKAFGNPDPMGNMHEGQKHWIDIDLKGTELPVWKAFELF